MNKIIARLREIYSASPFASENLSFREALSYLAEWKGYEFDPILFPDMTDEDRAEILSAFERIADGYPLQYVTGFADFYRSVFRVREGVLIPRRDSETLVSEAVSRIPQSSHFLDLCCGSGCLGISVLLERRDTTATLVDISDIALETARENASRLGVSDRCRFMKLDLLSQSHELPDHSALIMNPPYLTSEEMKMIPRNVSFEPTLALDGGDDGLIFYRLFRNHTGLMLFEMGAEQEKGLLEIFPTGETVYDLCRNPRVFIVK